MGGPMSFSKTASWMTAKRLRAHGLILAACLWSVYFWNMAAPGLRDRAGNLKGTDFLHFYTLGSLALAHRGVDLYNLQTQAGLAARRVSAAAGIRYLPLYPPQVSILFAPFARLSYLWALALWLTLSAFLYGLSCYAVWRACADLRKCGLTVVILALAFPAFWHLIAWGQTSALALACFTLTFFALRARREFLAGMALGCLIFKPQLGLAAAVVFLFALRWRVIAGAIVSAAAELIIGWLYYGRGPLQEWGHMLANVSRVVPLLEPRPYQTHCLRTFWTMLVPWSSVSLALYMISAVMVSGLTVACWRGRGSLAWRFSALLFASVLLAPHLTVYDLVILAPAFLLISDSIVAQQNRGEMPTLKLLLYLAFVLPLVGPVARWTHVQLSVPVIAFLLYGLGRMAGKPISLAEGT
jgi:hypothetical protein